MNTITNTASLEDFKINTKIKLAGLWATVTLCYVYGDIVAFYQPGAIDGILSGRMGPLGPTTQELLLGVGIFMSTSCAMIFISLFLRPKVNRLLNMIFGFIHSVVMILTMLMDPWGFYIYFGIIEVFFTVLIVWYAWNWPKVNELKESILKV